MTLKKATKKTLILAVLLGGLSFAAIKATALVTPGEIPLHSINLAGTDYTSVTPGSREVASLSWGSESGDAGKSGGAEGALVGPSSFAVSRAGAIYLLDQVNHRVSVFASTGRKIEDVPTQSSTGQEIQTGQQGDFYILDSERRDPRVDHYVRGKLEESIPISTGKGHSARYPTVTGLSVHGKRVSTEFGHEQVLDLTDETGQAVATPDQEVAAFRGGRQLQGVNENRVSAEEVAPDHVDLVVTSANGDPVYRVRIGSRRLIESILDVQSDRTGNFYVLLHLMKPNTSTKVMDGADALALASFSPTGDFRGQIDMPYAYTTDRFREITVTDSGEVYQMQTSGQGLKIVSWPALEQGE